MNNPLVSVITNSYNCAKYLPANLESMLGQAYQNWEHIVIDCGSKDGSVELLKSNSHPRLRLLEVPFCGVAKGRMLGIDQARGELVAILDADDTAFPERLSRQVSLLNEHSDIVAVGGGVVAFNEATGSEKAHLYPERHDSLMLMLRSGFGPIPHSSLTYRRTVYDNLGGYSETQEKAEDFDLILRMGRTGRLASLQALVIRLLTHRSDSHTFKHRPKGRDENFYATLSILMDTAKVSDCEIGAASIESWLDGIGVDGIQAMQARWALRNAARNVFHTDLLTLKLLIKFFLSRFRKVLSNHGNSWWRSTASPEDALVECQRNIQHSRERCPT